MSGKSKILFALVLVVLLAGFAFFIFSNAGHSVNGTHTLPDGSTLRLGGVQFTNGNFSYSARAVTGWRANLAKMLPKRWITALGWTKMTGSIMFGAGGMGTNLCVFTVGETPLFSSSSDLRMTISDDSGNTYDVGWPSGVMTTSDQKTQLRAEGWCPPAFPRRGKNLDVRFYQRGRSNAPCVAEFNFPNPARGNYPAWTPEPQPWKKTDGDLSITLASLKSGLDEWIEAAPGKSNKIELTQAAFKLVQNGHEASSWRPVQVEISDATGNHWIPFANAVTTRHTDDLDYFSFHGALWPGEAAWKMRFEFARNADFAPDEMFTFSGITVPGATQVINLDNATNIGDIKLQLVAITGEKAEQPGYLKWSTVKNRVNISIRANPFPTGYRLNLLKVTDDTGRECQINHEPDWNPPERNYGFKAPKGASMVNFTFALHKSRFAEFVVKPEFPRVN